MSHSQLPSQFLSDLDFVHGSLAAVESELPPLFLSDLEIANVSAQEALFRESVTIDELKSLEIELGKWRAIHQARLSKYLEQLPPDDPLRMPVSLFGTMDYGRLETAHTRTLAWLLDEKAKHGFGSHLLVALLREIQNDDAIRLTVVEKVVSELYIRPDRIDIFARGKWNQRGVESSWYLAIEAKVDAGEGEDQLSRYDEWLLENCHGGEILRVFLTPNGQSPGTGLKNWTPLTFTRLAGIFRVAMSSLKNTPGYHFLRYYLAGVLHDICDLPFLLETGECPNPYLANEYLKEFLGPKDSENRHE